MADAGLDQSGMPDTQLLPLLDDSRQLAVRLSLHSQIRWIVAITIVFGALFARYLVGIENLDVPELIGLAIVIACYNALARMVGMDLIYFAVDRTAAVGTRADRAGYRAGVWIGPPDARHVLVMIPGMNTTTSSWLGTKFPSGEMDAIRPSTSSRPPERLIYRAIPSSTSASSPNSGTSRQKIGHSQSPM